MNGPSPSTPLIRSFAVAKRLGWSAANLEGAVRTLNRVETWLAEHGTTLMTATTEDLNEYLGERLGEVSPNTVIVDQRQLRAFYKWAVEGDYPYVTTGNPGPATPARSRVRNPTPTAARESTSGSTGRCWPPAGPKATSPGGAPR